MSRPPLAPVPDLGVGPAPVARRADDLAPGLCRLTAPNPGLMTGPGTNTYLVGRGRLAVVDPGPDDPTHLDALVAEAHRRRATVATIVVTHTHPDHAPGAAALAARTGAEVVGFGAADGFLPDRTVGDGDLVAGDSFALRAIHTPGHASNHLCFLIEGAGVLLTGDHVMHGSTVVIRPPDGDMNQYLASLERLAGPDPGFATVAPGHGRLIGDPAPVLRATIAHRLERERTVACALAAAGEATVDDLLPTVYADVAEALLPVARFSLWAHLRKLAADGRAVAGAGPAAPVGSGAGGAPVSGATPVPLVPATLWASTPTTPP